MKFPLFSLLSILPFVAAHEDEKLIDIRTRFLADRDVPLSELETKKTVASGLWMAFNGIVYDVTTYAPNHPGLVASIEKCGGKECDAKFVAVFGHPTIAVATTYPGVVRIGPLVKPTGPVATPKPVSTPATPKPVSTPATPKPVSTPTTPKPVSTPATPKPVFTTTTKMPASKPVTMLSFDPIAGYEPLTKVTDQVSGLQKGIVETYACQGAHSNTCLTSLECNCV